MRRRLRGVAALAALLLVLCGAPWALARWGRIPPDWSSLVRPDDGTLLLAALTLAGWLAWAAFAASTLVEVAALATAGRHRLRIPLLGPVQQASAGLLLAVLALVPAPSAAPATGQVTVAPTLPEPEPPIAPDGQTADVEDTDRDGYLIQAGDDLWSVSERTLGDGRRWRELVAANPELLKDPTTRLRAGTRLALPAAARRPREVTVERGDTLSGLALEHLGAAGRWPRIADANRDLIEDPDHIEVGWRLDLPAPSESKPASRTDHPEGDPSQRPPDVLPTAPPVPTPAGSATAGSAPDPSVQPEAVAPGEPAADSPLLPLAGTIGTLAAAALLGVIETRRFLRLRERPLGRRLIPPEESAIRLRTALGLHQRPDRLAVLDAALREIGRHCFENDLPLPELERIVVGGREITIEWAGAAPPPPPGFGGDRDHWSVDLAAPPAAGGHPCPYPAVVSLGSTADGELVVIDAERSRVLAVDSADAELRRSTLAAMVVELACAPWSAEVRLVVAGEDAPLAALAGGDRVEVQPDADRAIDAVRSLVARRRAALGEEDLATLRRDPDRADAVAPVLFCLLEEVPPEVAVDLDRLLAGPRVGVAALVATSAEAGARWSVGGDADAPTGHLAGGPGRLFAHAIPEATRTGVSALLRAAEHSGTTPAPWWSGPTRAAGSDNVVALPQRAPQGGDDVDVLRLVQPTGHPQVLLIGPAELRGATGPEPSRSRQQLVELCAWLVEHPGSTATATAAGLGVAESTRRSNLSRLRAWLGAAPDGSPYLPDAYSGRVLLHPGITSDWHRLQLLLQPGLDRVGDSTLVAALDLVRGAPLADAAPGQWHWAEELRIDISSALRDVGVVLAERALAADEIHLARWAAARALVVAPEDEQLLCARISTEHRAGNTAEVERLVQQVTRQARLLGVDLLPETVELCQSVIEGRHRARA